MSTVEERVRKIISEQLAVPAGDIQGDHRLKDDLGADSLDSIEILMFLENDFEVSLDDEVAEQWKTVGDIYSYFEDME